MTALLKPVAPCLLLLEGGYNLSSTALVRDPGWLEPKPITYNV